jgi:hypothetical protein
MAELLADSPSYKRTRLTRIRRRRRKPTLRPGQRAKMSGRRRRGGRQSKRRRAYESAVSHIPGRGIVQCGEIWGQVQVVRRVVGSHGSVPGSSDAAGTGGDGTRLGQVRGQDGRVGGFLELVLSLQNMPTTVSSILTDCRLARIVIDTTAVSGPCTPTKDKSPPWGIVVERRPFPSNDEARDPEPGSWPITSRVLWNRLLEGDPAAVAPPCVNRLDSTGKGWIGGQNWLKFPLIPTGPGDWD